MVDKHSHILKKAIAEMSTYKAPTRVWTGIQGEIVPEQNRIALEKAVRDYAKPIPSPVSWEELSSRMTEEKYIADPSRKNFVLSTVHYWWASIAAATILCVCIGVYLTLRPHQDDIRNATLFLSPEASEEEALKFIDMFCSDKNVTCTSEEFVQLKAELDESTQELKEIGKQLSVFKDDPALLQAKSTVEKYRATVLRELALTI